MCDIDWLPKFLIWSFVAAALMLAMVSRKLNDHLLVTPTQPSGPFSFLFRRKYHVKPGMLFDPVRHFDADGQQWAKLFSRLMILSAGLMVLLIVVMRACGRTIGA
jgi:hypothetical protein